jgi:hypothetical protein
MSVFIWAGDYYFFNKTFSVHLIKYCSGDKIEKNEMGGSCGTYGGGVRRMQGFGEQIRGKETTGKTQA